MRFTDRPSWLSALIAGGVGFVGQLIISLGLLRNGFDGPLVSILAPGLVGLVAALAVRDGWGAVGLTVGLVIGLSVASLADGTVAMPDSAAAVIGIAAALGGYITGYAVRQQNAADFMPRPLDSADIARLESDVRSELRTIDPNAPGAFEHATVLLRTVTEQVGAFGPWSGPRPANETAQPPTGLLQLQAELLETARIAALAAGARRVVINSSGMGGGIDVQAVFGDPIGSDEPLRRPTSDVD